MPRTRQSTKSSPPILLATALVFAGLNACKGGAVDIDDTGEETTEQPVSDQAPTVSDLDAYCYRHEDDEQDIFFWVVNGRAGDPQGEGTLVTNGLLEIYRDGGLVEDFDLVVGGDGEVVTSFNTELLGIPCNETAPDYVFRAIVYDEEGHEGWSEVAGRQQ